MDTASLPITAVLDELRRTLSDHPCAVLQAPPGAGKTTAVPLALLSATWLAGRKILLLAPRRLAARAAAARMADMLREPVGQTVGYRVRMDSRVSVDTRIEVVTEGILTRRLQRDPGLTDTGLVIFDEFHERSLEADLALALCLDMRGVLNSSLRLLVMSATVETGAVAGLLGHAPVIACDGRRYAVETHYIGSHTPELNPHAVVRTVAAAAGQALGGILVFLPGAAQIRAVADHLHQLGLGAAWSIFPLFGNLAREDQDRAIQPAPEGRFKIVLATDIAETSLTIEGISVVVDSGLQRRPRFDPRSGMTRLVTLPISRASADQRQGRAGRTGPGVCYRLWARHAHASLVLNHRPEILEADLAGLALELAIWGVDDPTALRWLDPPPAATYENARDLLQNLGALDARYRILPHGREMAALPVHPRLAHMVIKAAQEGRARAACDLAALIMERDIVRFDPANYQADVQLRFDLLQAERQNQSSRHLRARVDQGAVRRTLRVADNLYNRLRAANSFCPRTAELGRLLAWAYPDRIAQRRPGMPGGFLLANGKGAFLDLSDHLATQPFLVVSDLDGQQRNARIFQAVAYDADRLAEQFAEQIRRKPRIAWDARSGKVSARQDQKFHALTLTSDPLPSPDPGEVAAALLEGIRQKGITCLPWTKTIRQWQYRVCFLHRLALPGPPWPDLSDQRLMDGLEQWLAPYLDGVRGLDDLKKIDLGAALAAFASYSFQSRLDLWAPTHLEAPSGSRIPIDYSGEAPVLAVRLQEMFGLTATPRVALGRQPLQIHLLSPAGRPLQITQDLEGFWKNSYQEVKREMKGRYPKHYWPDDPLSAQPTARAKPKKK